MSTRLIWTLTWLSLLMTGCHYRDPSIDLLEGELRWMEDQLYIMEDELEQACADLAQCQGGADTGGSWERVEPTPAALPTPAIRLPRSESSTRPKPSTSSETFEAPTVDLPDQDDSATDEPPGRLEFEIPRVELPDAEPTPIESEPALPGTRPQLREPQEGRRPVEPPDDMFSIRLQSHATAESMPPRQSHHKGIDAHVTHIVITPWRGTKWAARPFDSDLFVVVEPRNADGEYVALPGPVSVVVLDGKQTGAAARVERWDFDASQTARLIRRSESARGIHLQLEWPAEAPDSDQLQLYVRYETVDGRKLQADQRLADPVEQAAGASASAASQWSVVEESPLANRWTVVEDTESEPAVSETTDAVPPEPNKLPFLTTHPDSQTAPARKEFEQEPVPLTRAAAADRNDPVLRQRQATRPKWQPFR